MLGINIITRNFGLLIGVVILMAIINSINFFVVAWAVRNYKKDGKFTTKVECFVEIVFVYIATLIMVILMIVFVVLILYGIKQLI